MRRVSVAEKNGSCMDAVNVVLLKYRYSTGVMIAGGEACGNCVPQTVLDSGSDVLLIGETVAGGHFPGVPTVCPYERGPSVSIADGGDIRYPKRRA